MKSNIHNSQFIIHDSVDRLHHAYLIEGEKGGVLPELYARLEEAGFPTKNNPDLWVGEFDTFTIADARALRERAARKPMGERKIFVLALNTFPYEAQNALLKTLEDPALHTHFFIIMSRASSLLPTLRSRLYLIKAEVAPGSEIDTDAFLAASAGGRIELIQDIVKNKDKQRAIQFLNALEEKIHDTNTRMNPNDANILAEIQKARRYLHDRAPSVKMLLEHVALIVPRVA